MTLHPAAAARLSSKKSLRLLFVLLAVMLGVTFFGGIAMSLVLPALVPAGTSTFTIALLDAALLSIILAAVALPLMLHFRQRNLRLVRRAMRLQHTLDQHAIVSITDVTGRITFVNERFCEITGYTRQELIGQNHRLLKSGEHPPEIYEDMWRTVAQGNTWHGEICNRRKSGSLYWVNATIAPFLDDEGKPEEYVAIRTEISAQKALEKVSRQQEGWLRTILDNLGEGVYTLDANGRLDYLNAEAQRLIGWRLEELAGKGLHDIIHHHRPDGSVLPAAECPIHLAMRDRRVYRSSDEVFFHKDGTSLPVKITGAPLALDGQWQGSVAVFSDMREERLLNQRLLEARDAAEQTARLKAEFLSTMSHEIRTPLNGVIGMTDLLLDTPLDNEQTEFAGIIKTSADALLAIVNDILDFSKIEAGRLVLEHTDFSLRQVVEGSLDVLAEKANEKDLTLASFIAPELPDHLLGDPTRIGQILLNFLSNAVKFTASGRVVVSVHGETGPERESGSAGHGRTVVLKLAVQDSGIGLTQAAREKLFQPFSQADSSTTRRYGGTGLGLSICKRLGETMGGEIGVDSAPGEGASFWVRVPLEVAEEKRAGMRPLEALGGKLVLMAGGEVPSRDIRCTYFDAWQMRCEVLPGLAELHGRLAALENDGLIPDALVLAHPLSDATIMEAVASLQAHCKHPRLICCLGQVDRQMKAELISHGVIVTQQPTKQSVLFNALVTPLPTGQVTPKRRVSDVVDYLHGAQVLADKHRLLLAEDNPVNQRVAVHMLNKLGYAVDVVDNGSLALLALARESYDLVLMDCQMPEMDGFDATAAIRRTEANTSKHVPIVAMTANALQGDREQCLAAGMDDYIAKPIETPQLASLLAKWLPKAGLTTRAKPTTEPVVAQYISSDGKSTNDTSSPAIDMRRLTEMFGEDDAVINELLEVFEQSLRPLRERLKREARDRGQQLKGLAHELRGASANVGALDLADLAGQLEKLSPGRNWVEIEALVTRIDEESTRTIEFIFRRTGRT